MNKFLPWLIPLLSVVISIAGAQPPGSFTAMGNMRFARSAHTATLLTNGKVLLAGGGTSTAELFDASTGSFEPTGSMTTPRRFHTATLLADGRVLLVGGFVGTSNAITTTAELYDPVNGAFAPAGAVPSTSSQAGHTATLLGNGKVLIAGLDRRFPVLFNPASGHFETGARYADPNVSLMGTATLLRDGKVLLTGLINTYDGVGFAEIYDPATDAFSSTGGPTPDLRWCWNVNTATLLRDGKVLIVGNAENDGSPADAVLYNPATGLFTRIGHTSSPHEFATATLLPDGTVLIAGGQLPGGSGDAGVDLFEPASGTFYPLGTMITARHSHTATLLRDGRVLITGGNTSWPNPGSTAETFQPLISAGPARLINLSARATVGNGAGSLVAGFALQGAGAKSLLIRGVGPTLARPPFSVPGAASGVQLRLNNRAGVSWTRTPPGANRRYLRKPPSKPVRFPLQVARRMPPCSPRSELTPTPRRFQGRAAVAWRWWKFMILVASRPRRRA